MQSLLDSKWQIFFKVAALKSLTRAAIALNLPQSTVSRQIAALERECGARLFRRTGRGVTLTDLGEQLLPQLVNLATEADRITDIVNTKGGSPSGEVRVGLLPSTVPLLAAQLFALVREQFPLVQLHLIEGSNAQLEEQLREGRIDFGLVLRESATAEPGEHVLTESMLHLVGMRNDPLLASGQVPLAQLQGLPLIVPSRPHPLRIRLEALAEARDLSLNFSVTADSIHLQHEIATTGAGYAVSSGLFESRHHSVLKAAAIIEPQLMRCLVLAGTLRRPSTLASREIERTLIKVVPGLLKY